MVNRFDCGTHFDGGVMIDSEDGEFVEHKDYAELEARCAALAAENAGLNKFIDDECYVYGPHDVEPVDAALERPETPATDAFLAEVRAHGVEQYAEHLTRKAIASGENKNHAYAHLAANFAAQLRQEAK